MDIIIKKFEEAIATNDYTVFAFVIFVFAIFKVNSFIKFIDERKQVKVKKLSDAINYSHFDFESNSLLKELLAVEHFKQATGVSLTNDVRVALLKHYTNSDRAIAFNSYKTISTFLKQEGGQLIVKITALDCIVGIINAIAGIFLMLLGVTIFLLKANTPFKEFAKFSISVTYSIGGILMLSQIRQVITAVKIRKILNDEKDRMTTQIEATLAREELGA